MTISGAPASLWGGERSILLPRSRACNAISRGGASLRTPGTKGPLDSPLGPSLLCNQFSSSPPGLRLARPLVILAGWAQAKSGGKLRQLSR